MNTIIADQTVSDFLAAHPNACSDGQEFARKYQTMSEVWEACENPSWMLWICSAIGLDLDKKTLRLFACACVRGAPIGGNRVVWDLLKDERSKNAVVVAEMFANGEATDEQLAGAKRSAHYAHDYADAAYAAYAAYAAAYAAAVAVADAVADAAAVAHGDVGAARKWQSEKLRTFISNPFKDKS